jgi:PAS domain S-box-containing protein
LEDCRSDYKVEFRLARRTARTAGYWQLLYCGVPRTDGNAVPGCHLAVTEARCEEEEHTELLTREQAARHDAAAVRQQLDVILENISDGLVALDKDWRYTYVNRHAAELFGRRPEDLIGRHIWTEFPEGIGQPFHLAYEKAMAERIVIQMENYYERNRWFENRIYPSPAGLSSSFTRLPGVSRLSRRHVRPPSC